MKEQPEALRLADELEDEHYPWPRFPAAAELRRLWAENEAIKAERDALLEACRAMLTFIERHAPRGLQPEPGSPVAMARAAIKAAEGENHAKNL